MLLACRLFLKKCEIGKWHSFFSVLGTERPKWEYNCSAVLENVKFKELAHWMEQQRSFVVAAEFSRHPDRVFPAVVGRQVRGRYFNNIKGMIQAGFQVLEV